MAGAQQYPKGALYVVATPIGNLADIGLRALHVLATVDAVACEDTRVSGGLLRHFRIEGKPLLALHAHNEREAATTVLARLAQGERVAYVSDAGTPGISDPGARLVAAVRAAGHRCVPIPGASSLSAALSVAGDANAGGFAFVGFLPTRTAERARCIEQVSTSAPAQVLLEAPHRIATLIEALARACPDRLLTIGRELTKQFETVATLRAEEAPAWLAADADRRRGEFVLVLHGRPPDPVTDSERLAPEVERMLAVLLRELPLSQAATLCAEISGQPRKLLYARALALREQAPD